MGLTSLALALVFIVLIAVLWGCSGPKPRNVPAAEGTAGQCPDLAQGETPEDCPWSQIARATPDRSAQIDAKAVFTAQLDRLAPNLKDQLVADSHRSSWHALWGSSINYDEFAHGMIVNPAILEAIRETMAVSTPIIEPTASSPVKGQIVHAGMEHTYGYLFSVLKTSFGYKRARWVRSIIESGFGLPMGMLGPNTPEGTLFSNITYFIGNISFQTDKSALAELKKGQKGIPQALRKFSFKKLKPIRLEEKVNVPDTQGHSRLVVLRTDLVPFTAKSTDPGNTHLLIYSVVDPAHEGAKLITAFPVANSFVQTVMKPENLGDHKPVITRYNGFVDGLTGKSLDGTRMIIHSRK
jgi:hypothetical protein